MNLRQFIKGHWSALIGGCLVLLLEVIQETGHVEIPLIGSQKGLNVLFLILSFLEVLSVWNCRIDSDVRHTALLQICLIVCEAYIINIDVFSNSIQKWSDFIESGWNLTWIICGIFELSLISGHLGKGNRVMLKIIRETADSFRAIWKSHKPELCDLLLIVLAFLLTVVFFVCLGAVHQDNRIEITNHHDIFLLFKTGIEVAANERDIFNG